MTFGCKCHEEGQRRLGAVIAGDTLELLTACARRVRSVIVQPDDQTRVAIIARDFAKLTPAERDQTLVLAPTREGRQRLTDAIRAALLRDRTLGEDAVVASVLEPRGLRRADTAHARSYQPGDVVAFRKGDRHEGIHSSQGATCDRVMAHLESFRANTVDAASVYVAISRARKHAAVYTDSRASLTEALCLRDGAQVGAVDGPFTQPSKTILSNFISH